MNACPFCGRPLPMSQKELVDEYLRRKLAEGSLAAVMLSLWLAEGWLHWKKETN